MDYGIAVYGGKFLKMTVKIRGVAFVITVYNKERYLEGTLKSILAQEGGFDRDNHRRR